jgi:hypothetical protein
VPVADRPWFASVWQAADQVSALEACAGVCTLIGARNPDVRDCSPRADESVETTELWATLCRNRRAASTMVIRKILEIGPLRTGVSRAIDSLWVLNDPTLYSGLVLKSS